jgi:hypothetical protein
VVSTVEELVAAELAPPQVVSSDAATAMAAVSAAFGLSTPTAAADTSKDGQADADAGGDDDDADEFGAALAATEDSSVAGVVAEVDVVVKPEPAKARGGVSLATLESAKIRAAAEESAKKRVQEEVVARERYVNFASSLCAAPKFILSVTCFQLYSSIFGVVPGGLLETTFLVRGAASILCRCICSCAQSHSQPGNF